MKGLRTATYWNRDRQVIKKYGKWTVTKSLGGGGYYPSQLMIDDGYNSYYMNSNKAYDNPYPIPQGLRTWLETIGYKYLLQEEKYND